MDRTRSVQDQDGEQVRVVEVDPLRPEVLAVQRRYVAELVERFDDGFDPGDLTGELPRYAPPSGSCLLALRGEEVLGTAALRDLAPAGPGDDVTTPLGEVKRMWVAPAARGTGLGRRLLAVLEQRARDLGYVTLRLDTNVTLDAARALYAGAGYREIERYNDNPHATHFFEKSLEEDTPTGSGARV